MKKLMTEWRKYIKEEKMADLDAEQAYSTKVRGVNVIINLKDTDLRAPDTVRNASSVTTKRFLTERLSRGLS